MGHGPSDGHHALQVLPPELVHQRAEDGARRGDERMIPNIFQEFHADIFRANWLILPSAAARPTPTASRPTPVSSRATSPGPCGALRERRVAVEPTDRVVGLSAQAISERFAAAARAAGIEPRLTAHSGRVGLATELTARARLGPRLDCALRYSLSDGRFNPPHFYTDIVGARLSASTPTARRQALRRIARPPYRHPHADKQRSA